MVSSHTKTKMLSLSAIGIGTWIVIAAVLGAVLLGFTSRGITAPRSDAAPGADFSAARASEATAPLVEKPRPVGSAENAAARELLSDRLEDMGFDIEIHEATGARTVLDEDETESRVGFTRNLVAERHGSDPTGTIVLATHIDSVNGAPGAADAGVGLSVILESLRALGDEAHRNDVAVLLVDGEEDGLLGSKALMESGELDFADPVVVLNHEARGTSGRPVVTRWSGPMHAVLPGMPAPEAESFTDALFEFIPNDTDFTEYRKAGWWGTDMAITGDSWAYHSPQDDLAHLDRSTLQHYGEMTLTLTRDLVDTDLAALDDESEPPVQMTAPWGIAAFPPWVLFLAAVAAVGAVVASIVVLRSRWLVCWRSALLGALGGVLTLAMGVGLAVALWAGASAVKPDMLSVVISEPFRSWPFFIAEVAAALGAAWFAWAIMARWLNPLAIGLGWSMCASVLVGALTVFSPGLGGWLLVPVAIAVLGLLASVLLTVVGKASPPRWALFVAPAIVTLVPMGWVFGAQFSALREFGITSSNGMLAGVALLSVFAIVPVLIVGVSGGAGRGAEVPTRQSPGTMADEPTARPRFARSLSVPAGILILAIALSGVGIWTNAVSDEPVQESVTAEVDADKGTTTWTASGTTEWGRAITGTTADSGGLQAPRCTSAEEANTPAEGDAEAKESENRVTIAVSSRSSAQRISIEPVQGSVRDIVVDGTQVTSLEESGDESGTSAGSTRLLLAGLEAGQEATVSFVPSAEVKALRCSDERDDLSVASGWKAPEPGSVSLVQPVVRVTKTLPL